MQIIGHRGAAGMALENTLEAIKLARKEKVDMIEFDLRVTLDQKLILMHDSDLERTCGQSGKIAEMTTEEVTNTRTLNGELVPDIHQAIKACGDTPILFDCKGKGWAEILHDELKNYNLRNSAVTAIDRRELVLFSQLRPDVDTYVSELTKPFDAIHSARTMGLSGVSLNFWVLHPLSYYFARHNNQKLLVFTVNHSWFARFLHFFFPKAGIITNKPDLMNKTFKKRLKNR